MTTPVHPGDLLQEWLDGRLDPARRAEVESHLATCPACRDERDRLAAARAMVREALASREMPPGFEDDLRAVVARERDAGAVAPPPATHQPRVARRLPARLALWGAAAAALVAFAVYLAWPERPASVVAGAHEVFSVQQSRHAPLGLATSDAEELARFFNARLSFQVKVYDLEAMGYRLVGGSIEPVAGRETSIAIYETPDGRRVVCQMFVATTADLPAGAERVTRDGIPFYVYREGGRTLVFWPEGRLICALVSDLPAGQVLAIAYAKAQKPPA